MDSQVQQTGQSPMNVVADDIVFSLQKAGGASVYWRKLVQVLNDSPDINLIVLERPEALENKMRAQMDLDNAKVIESHLPLRVDQLRSPDVKLEAIFHSSDYRVGHGTRCVNLTTVYDFICMNYYSGFLKWFSFHLIKNAVKKSDYLACISESTKRDLLRYIPEAKTKHIEVIHLAYDKDAYNYESVQKKSQVAFVGVRHLEYKNFKVAVEAVRQSPGITLQIIGSELTEKEREYLNSELGDRYESHVFPASSQICAILQESLALLYLSEYEGFGLPPLEAMASGCPVIAINRSSVPEVVGDAALLMEEANPQEATAYIRELQSDSEFLHQLIEAGLAQASKFSWDKTIQQTKELYRLIWDERF